MNSDRITGSLYGVAVGDALGAPLEFLDAAIIRQRHGTVKDMLGGGWLNVKPGEVTDDTQMTIAVARGIIESPQKPIEAIGKRFVVWYNSRPKDVGATCASSIADAISLARDHSNPTPHDWRCAAARTHQTMGGRSGGNGALMRTSYVGLYYKGEAKVCAKASDIAGMTHFDGVVAMDCSVYSLILNHLVEEDDLQRRKFLIAATIRGCKGAAERYKHEELISSFYEPTPTGWGVASFAAALHCIYTTASFEDAVIKAVNLGGDADTIGAITGGLAGALYGYKAIPQRWTRTLNTSIKEELDALSAAAAVARDITP